jgi:DNA ligase 1
VCLGQVKKIINTAAGKTDSEPGYALRFPRLVKFREADKKPEDATSVDELIKMFESQSFKRS